MEGAWSQGADLPLKDGEQTAAQRNTTVFNSDDDLSSFLAGLRAKYATLYAQAPELQQADAGGGEPNDAAAVAPVSYGTYNDAGSAGGFTDDPLLAGTSVAFDTKLLQLRSSLQSLQQLLPPPRATTTANLLDSFIAVAGPQGHISTGDSTDSRGAHGGKADPVAGDSLLRASEPGSEVHEVGSGAGTVGAAAAVQRGTDGGRSTEAGDGSGSVDGEDAAFRELAAGYSRRVLLQPPSSEASAGSLVAVQSAGLGRDEEPVPPPPQQPHHELSQGPTGQHEQLSGSPRRQPYYSSGPQQPSRLAQASTAGEVRVSEGYSAQDNLAGAARSGGSFTDWSSAVAGGHAAPHAALEPGHCHGTGGHEKPHHSSVDMDGEAPERQHMEDEEEAGQRWDSEQQRQLEALLAGQGEYISSPQAKELLPYQHEAALNLSGAGAMAWGYERGEESHAPSEGQRHSVTSSDEVPTLEEASAGEQQWGGPEGLGDECACGHGSPPGNSRGASSEAWESGDDVEGGAQGVSAAAAPWTSGWDSGQQGSVPSSREGSPSMERSSPVHDGSASGSPREGSGGEGLQGAGAGLEGQHATWRSLGVLELELEGPGQDQVNRGLQGPLTDGYVPSGSPDHWRTRLDGPEMRMSETFATAATAAVTGTSLRPSPSRSSPGLGWSPAGVAASGDGQGAPRQRRRWDSPVQASYPLPSHGAAIADSFGHSPNRVPTYPPPGYLLRQAIAGQQLSPSAASPARSGDSTDGRAGRATVQTEDVGTPGSHRDGTPAGTDVAQPHGEGQGDSATGSLGVSITAGSSIQGAVAPASLFSSGDETHGSPGAQPATGARVDGGGLASLPHGSVWRRGPPSQSLRLAPPASSCEGQEHPQGSTRRTQGSKQAVGVGQYGISDGARTGRGVCSQRAREQEGREQEREAVQGQQEPGHDVDHVLCGSPTGQQAAANSRAQHGLREEGRAVAATAGEDTVAPHAGGAESGGPAAGTFGTSAAVGENPYVSGRGGIAFSIGVASDPVAGRSPLNKRAATPPAAAAAAVPVGAPAATHTAAVAAATTGCSLDFSAQTLPLPNATHLDWEGLSRQLREGGFGALHLAEVQVPAAPVSGSVDARAAASAERASGEPAAATTVTVRVPEAYALHRCLSGLLEHSARRQRLVSELLAATEQGSKVQQQQEDAMKELQREAAASRTSAERTRRELAELTSQQIPKLEAKHAAAAAKLRAEATKLREALAAAQADAAAKAEEVRSLRAAVGGLQSAAAHGAEVEGAALRTRVAQLEAQLRARDKELEKAKAIMDQSVGAASDGQANALDRAYEAEAAARKAEAEAAATRAKTGQLEQALRSRDRDVASMREDLAAVRAASAAAGAAAEKRCTAAEDAARRWEAEAGLARGRLKEAEAAARAAKAELLKQKAESEALRSSAYDEIYRLEDECRQRTADAAAARQRAAQMEHAVRGRERELAKARDEKEAARAAEKERVRVAEEVSVRLETELQATKVRLAQAEGQLRGRERELGRLAELLRQTQGTEYEAWLKTAKVEEGSKKLESDFTATRLRVLQLEAALKGRDKELDKAGRATEALKAELHELTSRLFKSEEATRKAEAELAAARGKVLTLEGHLRVKEREQDRLVRSLESLKAAEAEVAGRQGGLEEAVRRLDGQLMAARQRAAGLEGQLRGRDAAAERLNRQLEAAKAAEFERAAKTSKAEEAARQADSDSAALRQRIVQLEGALRAKEREAERGQRAAEAARAAEAELAVRLADAEAAVGKMEGEAAAGRQRAAQLQEAVRARERELVALTRSLEQVRAAEHEASATADRTGEAARKLDGEAAQLRQRSLQLEALLKARDRELERAHRATEAAQQAAADAGTAAAEAQAAARRLEGEAAALRQRLVVVEGTVRARERDLEKAEKALEQARGTEADVSARQARSETALAAADAELAALRQRMGQLEAAARQHDKDAEKLARALEQSKAAEVEAGLRAQKSEEATRAAEMAAAALRQQLAAQSGSTAARDRDAKRMARLLALAEAKVAQQVAKSDEFVRKVEADLGSMRQRTGQLAALLRSRERQLDAARKGVDAAQAAEAQLAAQLQQAEEANHRLEAELAAKRQQLTAAEATTRAAQREVARVTRAAEAAAAARAEAAGAAAATAEEVRRLDTDLASMRQQLQLVGSGLRSRDAEIGRLLRQLDQTKAAEYDAASKHLQAEDGVKRLDADLASLRQRLLATEGAARGRDGEVAKLHKLLEQGRASERELESRVAAAEEAAGRLEGELAAARQRAGQLEGQLRAREREVERAGKALEAAKGRASERELEGRVAAAEEEAGRLEGELAAARQRAGQLEGQLRARERDVERAGKALEAAKDQHSDVEARRQRAEEARRAAEADIAALRQRLAVAEGAVRAREREVEKAVRGAQADDAGLVAKLAALEETVRRLESEAASARGRATHLDTCVRVKERELGALARGCETAKAEAAEAAARRREAEEEARKAEGEAAAAKARATHLEGLVKTRDKEVERLQRQLDAGRDTAHAGAATCGREAAAAKEAAVRAEAALGTARARITELESELVAAKRHMDGLQRLAGYGGRPGDAEAAAAAAERAGRAEEALRRLEAELGGLRQRYAQLEHVHRSREATLDKLKGALADKVDKEEKRLARDKAAYARIRAAYVASRPAGGAEGTPGGGGGKGAANAAGAMAAAARELRPVEIVGLYETRREAAEQELAAWRAEVRSLTEQLREAQNLIAVREASGAWRAPAEVEQLQSRVILLERRVSELQREADRAAAAAEEAGRAAERRQAETEHRVTQLKEDNEALVHELESRPTVQENRALKREVEILERRLMAARGSSALGGPGAAAEGGETALGVAAAARGRSSALLSTSARMARDKALHRLGLRAVEELPREVLVDVVQDVCIDLDVSDATCLPAAVRKACRVLQAAPRMEAHISAVCGAVWGRGARHVPQHLQGTTDPNKVLDVLEQWLVLLDEGAALRGAMAAVAEALGARVEGMAIPIRGPGDVVLSVRQLVEAEAAALTARDSLAAAQAHVAAHPEALLSRLLGHFQRLFDCPALEGVVPTANRLYVSLNELRNLARGMAAAVGLPQDAAPTALMARVQQLVEAEATPAAAANSSNTNRPPNADSHSRLLPDYIKPHPHASSPSPSSTQPPAQPSSACNPETTAVLDQLLALFAVHSVSELPGAADRAVCRLRRLDAALPRYQRLAGQLLEVLRVTELEEVLPALQAAIRAAAEQGAAVAMAGAR